MLFVIGLIHDLEMP
jgi:hypothetical protein